MSTQKNALHGPHFTQKEKKTWQKTADLGVHLSLAWRTAMLLYQGWIYLRLLYLMGNDEITAFATTYWSDSRVFSVGGSFHSAVIRIATGSHFCPLLKQYITTLLCAQ